jgi:hypothetical protein
MDVEINGQQYRIGKLDARKQLHVARRLASTPMSVLIGAGAEPGELPDAIRARAEASGFDPAEAQNLLPMLLPALSLRSLGELSEADCDYIVNNCLSVCHRQSGANGAQNWLPVFNAQAGQLAFQDIDLDGMLQLTVQVLRENLGSFFGGRHSPSPAPLATVPVSSG